MNQTVLNVIELVDNNVVGVESFIVRIEADDSKNQEDVALAESHFIAVIEAHNSGEPLLEEEQEQCEPLSEEDREFYLENAIYDDDNGYVVQLVWSN